MSWFTADATTATPACPRCQKPDAVAWIRRVDGQAIWDCRACALPTQRAEKGASSPRPNQLRKEKTQ